MTLTMIILFVLLLFVVQLFLQETTRYGFNLWQILGNRDTRPEKSVIAARLDRAKKNMQEAIPLFLGLALLALIKKGDASEAVNGAMLFLVARVIYVPLYAMGVPVLRSVAWLTGMAGLVMMALALL